MVTGRVPFDADTPVSVALKHMQEKPIPPITINPVIPQSLNDIILKAMEKDPDMRYRTATEMIEDLDKIIKNQEFEVSKNAEPRTDRTSHQKPKTEKKGFKKFIEEHKAVKIALIVAIFLIVFIASIGITLSVLNKETPKDVALPDFTGLTLEEAKAKAEASKLTISVREEKYDVAIEEGKIISQEPKYQPNFTVKEGKNIEVDVSKGQEIIKVTKFIGKTKDEAIKMAKELGLELTIEEDYSDDVQAGIVISQSVAEGEEVFAGTKITAKVSLGIEQVEVPDLTGKTEEEAKATITEAKLKYKATEKIKDSSKGKGVVEQSISAGSFVDKNTEIKITINEYQEMKDVTLNINVANLSGYKKEYTKEKVKEKVKDEETGEEKEVEVEKEVEIPAKNVSLFVTVDGDTKENRTVKQNSTNEVVKFSGKGTVHVIVKIDDVTRAEKDLNLETETVFNL